MEGLEPKTTPKYHIDRMISINISFIQSYYNRKTLNKVLYKGDQ